MAIATDVTTTPRLTEKPARRVAVVYTRGEPHKVASAAIEALYGCVETLAAGIVAKGGTMEIEPLRARWPNSHIAPPEDWIGMWALPVPGDTEVLPQPVPGFDVRLETWTYGPVAEVLHEGPFSEESETLNRLHEFIAESGRFIIGAHEEVYLTAPGEEPQRTIILYPVGPFQNSV